MAWVNFPVSAGNLISVAQYEEIYNKALVLYSVFDSAHFGHDYTYPWNTDFMLIGRTYTVETCLIGLIRKYIQYMHWYGLVNSWWRGFYYLEGGVFVEHTFLEVIALAGLGGTTKTWAAPNYAVGEEYSVDDVVWAGVFYEARRICIQAHTGAGGDKAPLLADSAYWKLYQPIVKLSEVNDGKTILDYIKNNRWVKHATFKSGTAASPTYNERKKLFETYSWGSTRETCTTLAQQVWDLARSGDPETVELDAPHVRILNRRYNNHPGIRRLYKGLTKRKVNVQYTIARDKSPAARNRTELIIANYPLPRRR